jgi:two-component system sensor histidine kinase PhoQ
MSGRPGSLSTRLLVITAVMLVAAFGGTIAVLDIVFRRSAEQALADQLETQVSALIGAVEPDDAGNLTIPDRLLEPRLANPGSGLYAEILDASGLPLWRSPSAVGLDLATGATLIAGQRTLTRRRLADGTRALLLGVAINWELGPAATPAFQVFTAADLAASSGSWTSSAGSCSAGSPASCSCSSRATGWPSRGLQPLRRCRLNCGNREGGQALAGYPRELEGRTRLQHVAALRAPRRRARTAWMTSRTAEDAAGGGAQQGSGGQHRVALRPCRGVIVTS